MNLEHPKYHYQKVILTERILNIEMYCWMIVYTSQKALRILSSSGENCDLWSAVHKDIP